MPVDGVHRKATELEPGALAWPAMTDPSKDAASALLV
jgi:hypothetical protein